MGTIRATLPGKEIIFQRAIDGQGTFESASGGILHFTAASSGDVLINNGRLQLDADFVVARDYRGAITNGNIFDARRNVSGPGRILAADARQTVGGPGLSGNVINFGAMRVNGTAGTTLSVTNSGGLTTLRGAVQANNTAISLKNFIFGLAPGASQTATLTFSGKTAGAYFGQMIDVVNNFDNVADDHLFVRANVYAPAIASIANRTLDFGTVRKGTAGVTALAQIGNLAGGALNDTLALSFGTTPGKVSLVSSPTSVAAGTTVSPVYGLDTSQPGSVGGTTSITLASHNNEMADLSLGSQTLSFTGKVTNPAAAGLFSLGGDGLLSGNGNSMRWISARLPAMPARSSSSSVSPMRSLIRRWPRRSGACSRSAATPASVSREMPFSGLSAESSEYYNFLSFDTTGPGRRQLSWRAQVRRL